MDIQEIEIIINKRGHVELRVRGVKGKKCLQLTKELEESLGSNLIDREMTPEAREESTGEQSVHYLQVKSD